MGVIELYADESEEEEVVNFAIVFVGLWCMVLSVGGIFYLGILAFMPLHIRVLLFLYN